MRITQSATHITINDQVYAYDVRDGRAWLLEAEAWADDVIAAAVAADTDEPVA